MNTKKQLNAIMEKKISRAERNNNPLNIRRTRSQWMGLVENPTDKDFCQFRHVYYGWRAAFKILIESYWRKYGLRTPRQIISRWAPPADNNDTEAYIQRVCRGWLDPDTPLSNPFEFSVQWGMLAKRMAEVETGGECPGVKYMEQACFDVLHRTVTFKEE